MIKSVKNRGSRVRTKRDIANLIQQMRGTDCKLSTGVQKVGTNESSRMYGVTGMDTSRFVHNISGTQSTKL